MFIHQSFLNQSGKTHSQFLVKSKNGVFLKKNQTHAKKVRNTSEFLLGIYWWTLKITSYLKNGWNGPLKDVRILHLQCCIFWKKNKEKHLEISLFYTCLPKILIWSTVFEAQSVTRTFARNEKNSAFCMN